jgi:hypothetical protein
MDAELDRLEEEDSKRAAEKAKATEATSAAQPGAEQPSKEG